MAYKIKNINYDSISNANDYVVYTVAFEVEDTKSSEQASFTQDFYFTSGTVQDEVTASVISLLSGAVSIMYNKATYYNLSITSDEVADVISTVFAIPDLTTTSTITEAPVAEVTTSTGIDSFDAPASTIETTVVDETIVTTETTTTEPVAEVTTEESTTTDTTVTDTTTDTSSTDTTTDSGTTDTTSTDTTENNG